MAVVSIADQLKLLIELQDLDAQIYQLQRGLDVKPVQEAQLKTQHAQAVQALQAVEVQYKALDVKRSQMEIDLGQKEAQIQKLQAQLFQLKTNKEYAAMGKEIEGFKADKSVLEEETLKLMEEVDQVKAHLISEREALKAKESSLRTALAQIEEEKRQIEASIEKLKSTRLTLIPRADPNVLSRYERILERKEGLALVPVKGDACGGCHIVLPPQMINEIQLATRLILCESCARILYLESTG